MSDSMNGVFAAFGERLASYVPELLSGLALLAVGLVVAWLARRVVIRLAFVLRLERLLGGSRLGRELARGDVRHAAYNFLGNLSFATVFLVFLDAALSVMRLEVFSGILEVGVTFIPRLFLSLVILGLGWMVAIRVSATTHRALQEEDVPRASLIARFTKAVVLVFVAGMALSVMDFATRVVLIGFTVCMVTLGTVAILSVWSARTAIAESLRVGRDAPKGEERPSERG